MAIIPFLNNAYFSAKVGIGTDSPIGMLSVVNPLSNSNTWTPTNNPDLWVSNAGTSNSYYAFGVTTNSGDIFSITNGGNVGIGTTNNSAEDTNNGVPKLQVNTTTAVLGEFPLAARFTTASDAGDNSGVSVLINSGNDRGLMISAGRAVSNRSRATLNLVSFDGNELVDGLTLYMPNTGSAGATTGTNVGIGTTSPSSLLHLESASSPALQIKDTTNNVTFKAYAQDSNTHLANVSNHDLFIDTNNTTRITVKSGGNVGIGTTSPDRDLSVIGQFSLDDSDSSPTAGLLFAPSSGVNRIFSRTANNVGIPVPLDIYSGSSLSMRINDNGNVGIGTTSPVAKLHVYQNDTEVDTEAGVTIEQNGTGDAALSFLLTGIKRWKMGIDNNDSDKFKISGSTNLASDNKLTIDSSGNVGIGTTIPGAKLSVVGTSSITGTLTLGTTAGSNLNMLRASANYINATNATGYLVFRTSGYDTALTLDTSQNATFEGTISSGSVTSTGNGTFNGGSININGAFPRFNLYSTDAGEDDWSIINNNGIFGIYNNTAADYAISIAETNNHVSINSGNLLLQGTGRIQGVDTVSANTDAANKLYVDNAVAGVPIGNYLPLAGGTMTGQIIMGNASNSFSHELKFANNTYIAGIDFQNSGELRFIDRSGGRESITFNLLNGSIEARNTGNTVTNFISTSGNSYFNGGNVGIGTTSPSQIFEVSTTDYGVGKFTGNTDNGTGYVGAVLEIESNSNGRGRGVYLTHRDSTDTTASEWYAGLPYTGTGYTIGNAAYGTSVNSDTGPAVLAQSRFFIKKDGNVGIGTTSPGEKLDVRNGTITSRDSGNINYAELDRFEGLTLKGNGAGAKYISTPNTDDLGFKTNNDEKMRITSGGNVGIGTTTPAAFLDIQPSTSSRKVTRIANDVTSTYFYNQQVDAILAWTCGSYYQAEVVITANQTNGGDYNNLYIRGIWSNNHTSHNWDELEHIGSLTGSTFTMSVGQNGSTTASGRLELDFNYISQSFSQLNVRVTDFFGTHSYTIT